MLFKRNKQKSRNHISARRIGILTGLVFGGLLFGAFRLTDHLSLTRPRQRYSLFFGDVTDWQPHMLSYAPLDGALSCFFFGLMMYSVLRASELFPSPEQWPKTARDTTFLGLDGRLARMACGSCGFAAFAGTLCAIVGWYASLEGFLLVHLFIAILLVAVGIIVTILLGMGWIFERTIPPVWRRLKRTWLGRGLIGMGNFFDAQDVSEDVDPTPPTIPPEEGPHVQNT